jgi:hypothetical protein
MSIVKKIMGFLFFALVISSCGIGQNRPTVQLATPTIANSQTSTKTILPTQTPTITATLFDSNDADLYDNFNNLAYDGSINKDLWIVDSEDAPDISQTEGFLSIFKRSGTKECSAVSVNKYHGAVPQTPFYFQTDIKVDKPAPNSLVGIGIDGISPNKTFMSTCSIATNSQNSTVAECINHWYINDSTLTEHYYFPVAESNFINQWVTFRIDFDPRAATYSYFFNNAMIGSYQVIDSESLKKAKFALRLVVCAPQGLNNKGYFDNARMGILNQ